MQTLNCRYLFRHQGAGTKANQGKDKLPTAKHPCTHTILDFCLKKRESYKKKPTIETTAKAKKSLKKFSSSKQKLSGSKRPL
ncbi:hypothetical protein [Cellvibrio sp. KY-GH-1]|uniref:hypothetical protein n=1 Tax=Cellvibrio sp. KY-GH-1 TaxID=2303332 RepID=UPI00124497E8|nr:hypothetical protein [Cellvibrio sp. KY-GH-1]